MKTALLHTSTLSCARRHAVTREPIIVFTSSIEICVRKTGEIRQGKEGDVARTYALAGAAH